MIKFPHLTPNLGLAALLATAMIPTGAYAGEETRAQAAIAEASGKIDAGDKAGVGDQAPDLQRQAHQALISAQDLLAHHKKMEAIAAAQHAGELADQAMASANARKTQAERDRRNDIRDSASTAATANNRANSAEQAASQANMRADSAEQATNNANLRANSAEQSSAAANARADELRAPTTTTLAVTQRDADVPTKAPVHHVRHHPVRHHAHATHAKTTTTVVTTSHP
jgi:hypothetical protein